MTERQLRNERPWDTELKLIGVEEENCQDKDELVMTMRRRRV